jgi:hypothetical protein
VFLASALLYAARATDTFAKTRSSMEGYKSAEEDISSGSARKNTQRSDQSSQELSRSMRS